MKSQGTRRTITLTEETQKDIYQAIYLATAKTFVSGTDYGSSNLISLIKKMSSFDNFYKDVIKSLKHKNPMVKFFDSISTMKTREVISLKRSLTSDQSIKAIYLQIIDKYKNPGAVGEDKTLVQYMEEVLVFRSSLRPLETNQDRFNSIILISEIMKMLVEFQVESSMILPNLWLSDLIGSEAANMLRSINPNTLELISSRYLASEDINQQGLGYLFNNDSSLIIDFLGRNQEYLNEHLYVILTRAIQFENIPLIEFITSRIPEVENISQQNYLDIFQNILNAFMIGNKEVCKFIFESKLWNYLNINEQVTLVRTLVIRAEQTTLNELIDLMIEKGIFTAYMFMLINDDFLLPQGNSQIIFSSVSEEYKKEIAKKLESYQEEILLGLFETLNVSKQGANVENTVSQMSGIVCATKYFARSIIKKAVKGNYQNFECYIDAYRQKVKELRNNNNPNAKDAELFVRYFTEAEQEARRESENVKEVQDSWDVEIKPPTTKNPPKKAKKKKAPLQIAEDKKVSASEEKVSVVDSDQKPDDDGEEHIQEVAEEKRIRLDRLSVEEDHSKPRVERKSYAETLRASLEKEEQTLPIVVPVIVKSDAKPEEPEEIIITQGGDDRPDDDAGGSSVVQKLGATNPESTIVVEEIIEEIVEASTTNRLEQKGVVIISDETECQIDPDITFFPMDSGDAIATPRGSTLSSELQLPDSTALRFGNISPVSGHEDKESDSEDSIIFSGEKVEKPVENSIILTESTHVTIPKAAAPGNIYLGSAFTKTQWLYTDTGKLIYHLLITNYDQSLSSLYINSSNPSESLTQEEYRTLKPSEMSTEKSIVNLFYDMHYNPFYAVYVYNNDQLVLSYTIMPYQVTDGYSVCVEWQISSVISYAGSLQLTDNSMSEQQTEVQESEAEDQGTESSGGADKAKTHSEQGGSTNTNLSDSSQLINSSAILSAFKENNPERNIEFTVTLEINKDKENIIENEEAKKYKEHKEEVERTLEELYKVKISIDKTDADFINTTTLAFNAFDEKLFKPFLGEHDHPAFKFAGLASM